MDMVAFMGVKPPLVRQAPLYCRFTSSLSSCLYLLPIDGSVSMSLQHGMSVSLQVCNGVRRGTQLLTGLHNVDLP